MDSEDILELIEDIFTTLDNIKMIQRRYENNTENIEQTELETQDILHFIELNNYSNKEKLYIFNELKDCRQDRRGMKYENELLEPLYEIFEEYDFFNEEQFKFSELKSKLGNIKKEVDRVKIKQENRKYSPRVRDDLSTDTEKEQVIRTKFQKLKDKFD